jgi:hypothetical protein
MMTLKDAVQRVPQPYRKPVARTAFVVLIPLAMAFTAAIEGFGWLRETWSEIAEAWRETENW